MNLIVAPETIEFFPQAAIAIVERPIIAQSRGRVRCMATTWYARFYLPQTVAEALPGTSVQVIGREGLTLLVLPMGAEPAREFLPNFHRAVTQPAKRWLPLQQFMAWLIV